MSLIFSILTLTFIGFEAVIRTFFGDHPVTTPTPSAAIIAYQQVSPTPTLRPGKTFEPKAQPTTVSASTNTNDGISDMIYPGSSVNSDSANSLSLTSSDNVDSITSWYKSKIKSKNLSTNSFVATNSNNNVLNKLVGAGGNFTIDVEITKKPGDSVVQIKVGET